MNSGGLENNTLSTAINSILGIVKETLKKVNQIDRQVRQLTKELPKDIKPGQGVKDCIEEGWAWIPKPTSQLSVTISCVSQSTQCCLANKDTRKMVEVDHSIDLYSIYDLMPHNVLYDISKYLKDEAEDNFKGG